MEYETAGDPMSGLKWTRKTTAKISKELSFSGIDVGRTTVGKILKQLNFSLKTNAKKISSGGKPATAAAMDIGVICGKSKFRRFSVINMVWM